MKYDAIIVASGKGERAGLGFNKVFYKMKNGKTVLENASKVFVNDDDCKKIIIVTNDDDKVFKNRKVTVVSGGEKRQDSVFNGLSLVKSNYVFIHDGARPFLNKEDVEKLKKTIIHEDGAILALKEINTVKLVSDGYIKKTLNREEIYKALTPQAFKTKVIKDAYTKVNHSKLTDDASLLEKLNIKVKIVEGDPSNIKLTSKADFENGY